MPGWTGARSGCSPEPGSTGLLNTRRSPWQSRRFRRGQAYLDGELCGVRHDGTTSFRLIQNASDTSNAEALVFFLFDLLHLDGEALGPRPLKERKERLRALLSDASWLLHFSDHQIGRGQAFYDHACALKVEGIVSKRLDAPYSPGNRGLWLKVKCLNREEFVVVGWTV